MLQVIGDRWSLLAIRDMRFGNRHHSGALLADSEEGIASNLLAGRLRRLTEQGGPELRGEFIDELRGRWATGCAPLTKRSWRQSAEGHR
ncbi:MAG TPA: hypothetical protein VFK14_04590 [Solirubrobacterales bacterium]|nr:hypothetical protein [Solirubrobacterales bacterium]